MNPVEAEIAMHSNAERAAEKWNAKNPAGTDVEVTDDLGEVTGTQTRSEAWVLPSGHAVVQIKGKSGCVLLNRVRRREIS